MKVLLVGDLHIKRSNLKETVPLLDRVLQLSEDHDLIIHLGDLYNDHGVITADVQKVVTDFFDDLSALSDKKGFDVINIEGNHDQDGDGTHTSLYVHAVSGNRVSCITGPRVESISTEELGFLPYIRNPEAFEKAVQSMLERTSNLKIIFCHQEFNGAVYENGMYAPHGSDSSKFPNLLFISGHIHKGQEYGNVWYPGAPRWLTKSDANQARGLWSIEIQNGEVISKEFISSADICPAYHSHVVCDSDIENGRLPKYKDEDKVYIEYLGNDPKMLKKISATYNHLSLKHTKVQGKVENTVSESKGVVKSIEDYVNSYNTKIPKDKLLNEIFQRMS